MGDAAAATVNATWPLPWQRDTACGTHAGATGAIEIRRQLLKPVLELRSLYKVTALVAKVPLRAEGEDYPGDTEALHALLERGLAPVLLERTR